MSAAEEEEEEGGGEGEAEEEAAAGGGSGGSETSPHPDLPDHPDHHPDHPDQEDREEDREEEQGDQDEDREEQKEEDREEDEEGAAGGRPDKTFLAALHSDGSSSSSGSCVPTPSCRICFQGAEQGDLLNPCRCDGSVRYTHQHCLLKWISERGCWSCELCCYHFNILAINTKRPWQWQGISVTLVEKVQMVAVFLGSLFLLASITWLLWSALSPQALWQRRDVLFQICYGMYGFMDLVCMGLIVHEGAAVHGVFLRWRAVNLHWDVQSYDKAADLEESSSASRAAAAAPPGPRTLWLPLGPLGVPPQTSQLGPPTPWSCCPCWPYLCPPCAVAGAGLGGRGSGEVAVRVTSV